MADPRMLIATVEPQRSKAFGPAKVIKKTTGLYKSKRFHFQLLLPFFIATVSFVIGIIYVHSCPSQSLISIYLIVQGTVSLLIFVTHLIAFVYILFITKFKYFFIGTVAFVTAFLMLFLFAWFIAGNIWVFSIFKHVQFTDQTQTTTYCHGTLYQTAFWLIIAQYIMSVYFCCSFTFIPQSTQSPTNGIIKVRKQIPKIKRMVTSNIEEPPVTHTVINMRF